MSKYWNLGQQLWAKQSPIWGSSFWEVGGGVKYKWESPKTFFLSVVKVYYKTFVGIEDEYIVRPSCPYALSVTRRIWTKMPAAKFPHFPTRLFWGSQFHLYLAIFSQSRQRRVIWMTKPARTRQICALPASVTAARPVHVERSIEALRLGVGIFPLTYFYFNALKHPKSFLFHCHAFAWLCPFSDKRSPAPRWSVVASPACGYSRGFAHLCCPDSAAASRGWFLLAA